MSKVMRDWEDLEKKYQLMKNGGNGEEAETFKKSVTLRFQKTIKNLEDEGNAEKRQLLAVHQQRVLSHLNERKKESMECFTTSLTSSEQNPNKVRKCLEKLMRILHKDRHHTLTHYKHLLKSNPKQAEIEKDYTLQRLTQISLTARQGLVMLERYPPLSTKLRPLIEDYVLSLQGRDDPIGESLLTATHETEKDLLEKLTQQHVTVSMTTTPSPSPPSSTTTFVTTGSSSTPTMTTTTTMMETMETEDKDFKDQIISVRREVYTLHSNLPISTRPLYFTLTFAGITVLGAFLVGVLILVKRRVIDHPRNHGFLEVNQQLSSHTLLKSPEEKHVANMQINGYENPTYKYFEQN